MEREDLRRAEHGREVYDDAVSVLFANLLARITHASSSFLSTGMIAALWGICADDEGSIIAHHAELCASFSAYERSQDGGGSYDRISGKL